MPTPLHPRLRSLVAGALLVLLSSAQAAPILNNTNALIFGNFKGGNSSSQGGLVVGGNASILGYGVNSASFSSAGMVVGGNLHMQNSAVSGSIWTGGQVTGHGTATNGGSMHALPPGTVPFSLYNSYYNHVSDSFASLSSTGSVTNSWGTLVLTAAPGSSKAVFNLTSSQVSNIHSMSFVGLTAGQDLLINITGERVSFANMDLGSSLGAYSTTLNFVDAKNVSFNSIAVNASILATDAKISGGNGSIKGTVVAKQWDADLALQHNSHTQIGLKSESEMLKALSPSLPNNQVPEPATLLLTLLGLGAAGVARRLSAKKRS